MITGGVAGIVIAYLLGSTPAAYIITRLVTGRDIRQLGRGNVGARNTFREVGLGAGIGVGVFDAGKGVAAVAIANWLSGANPYFVLAAGLAVVAGHMWSIYLKFTGGNGLATTIGVLSVLLTKELLIALAITFVFIVITRNPVLSVNISLLLVPVSVWFLEKSWLFVAFTMLLALIMVVNFIPIARAALVKAGSKENLVAELLRGGQKLNKKID
ncbi:glycerol-3-phosphate acyltransferase [Chloroflexota bacterium]